LADHSQTPSEQLEKMTERLRVLFVEDNPADIDLIADMLSETGPVSFRLDSASRLSMALRRLEEGDIDLVLLDLGLPDSSGLQTFHKLRKARPDIPIVVLTGNTDLETALAAVREGAQDYLVKGEVNRSLLVRAARYAIERQRGEEALRESERKLRTLFEILPVGISILDAERKIVYGNPALTTILDISKKGLFKGDYARRTYLRPDGTPMPAEEFASTRAIKERRAVHNVETGVVKEDGIIIWTNVSAVPVAFPDWKVVIVTSDITERREAQQKLKEALGKLQLSLRGIIQVISGIMEMRDSYTAGHQRRVTALSRAIALEMGLAEDRVEGLCLAGEIHDLGKISVPAEILSKPTRLTEFEFRLIQNHPRAGYDILKEIDFPWPVAEIILQHHERMDGSGYPQGLRGADILLEARILAVADIVEAIASDRPYRAALGIGSALEELEQKKGIHYDFEVVKACLTLFREKRFAFP
jgi:PAS domain S-box-containing protein